VLAALACVDYVTIFAEDTAERLAGLVRPDVYVKGADYAQPAGDAPAQVDDARLPEAAVVRAHGGRVLLLPLTPGRSTSDLAERIKGSRGNPSR
jgi:bifunctional ADP-heptose synthase (sugar kinase/adenylyltransferase)